MKTSRSTAPKVIALATALSAAAIAPAYADKDSDTLNVLWEASIPTLDFYFLNIDEGYSLGQNICDTLVFRNPRTLEIEPLLATSWEWTGPTQLDLTLRQDVVFHDGEPFDADDVVYTLNWASAPETGAYGQVMVSWIDHVEKIDQYTVRIHQKEENRAVLDQLSSGLPIYPEHYHSEVGTEGFSTAPICTGPYRLASVVPGSEVVLEVNEDYFTDGPKGTPSIGRIVARSVQDANTRIAELMTGQADWIYRLTADQVDSMQNVPGIDILQVLGTRITYIMFNPINPPEGSPVTDPLVRQAVAHAINRDALVENLIRGVSVRLDTFCQPVMPGCTDGVFEYDYDPDRARELLAEAGYPDGFNIDLYAFRDRFVSEALIGDLQNVGINANLLYMQYGSLDENWRNGNLGMAHQSWGGFGMLDGGNHISSHILVPDTIVADEAIMDAVARGNVGATQEDRDAAYLEALEGLAAGAYWVPLYIHTDNYAVTEDLDYFAGVDGIARFYMASWK